MKAAKGGAPDGDGEGDEAAKTQQLNFRMYPEQVEIVEAALAKMKEEPGKDGRGVCLEWICASYLSGQVEIVVTWRPWPRRSGHSWRPLRS